MIRNDYYSSNEIELLIISLLLTLLREEIELNFSNSNQKTIIILLGAILLSLSVDLFILVIRLKNYLPVSILGSLIFFGTAGIVIGYNFKDRLPWGLIILVGIIRLVLGSVVTHGINIYEALISFGIIAIFIDLGISFKTPQNLY